MVIKREDLEEWEGCLRNKEFSLAIINDNASLTKASGFNKEPIRTFKSLPIGKLRKYNSGFGRGDCLVLNTIYNSKLIADALSLIGKRNIEFYQKEDDMPLGIKVGNKRICIAPVIPFEKGKASTIEEIIK